MADVEPECDVVLRQPVRSETLGKTPLHTQEYTQYTENWSYTFFFLASIVQYPACLQLGITFTAGTQCLKL